MSNRILTPESLAQGFASRSDYERVKHLLTVQTNSTLTSSPGLAEGGRPKYNINTLATNAALTRRSAPIRSRTSFHPTSFVFSRDPSLRGNGADEMRYLRRCGRNRRLCRFRRRSDIGQWR